MDGIAKNFDWSLMQSFLAVAETGSLSAAARLLGASQPTVGRHVQALEDQVGAELFLRQARGMSLSDAGARLLEPARAMREAASQFGLAAAGSDEDLSGTVRITASVFTSHYCLPDIISKLRMEEPDIQIELAASDRSENLLFREADIAVRMYRPEQLDMVTRHLGDFGFGFFASEDYLARRGTPETSEDLVEHDFIGYDRDDSLIKGMRAYGWEVTREDFPVRCDNNSVYWQLLKSGAGVGIILRQVGRAEPGMVELLADVELPGLPVWLTAHPAVRNMPRVARVWDALSEGLAPFLEPPGKLRSVYDVVP